MLGSFYLGQAWPANGTDDSVIVLRPLPADALMTIPDATLSFRSYIKHYSTAVGLKLQSSPVGARKVSAVAGSRLQSSPVGAGKSGSFTARKLSTA